MQLSDRLQAVASMVTENSRLADVGSRSAGARSAAGALKIITQKGCATCNKAAIKRTAPLEKHDLLWYTILMVTIGFTAAAL